MSCRYLERKVCEQVYACPRVILKQNVFRNGLLVICVSQFTLISLYFRRPMARRKTTTKTRISNQTKKFSCLLGWHSAWEPLSSDWHWGGIFNFPSMRSHDASSNSSPVQETSDIAKGIPSAFMSDPMNSAKASSKPSWRQITLTSLKSHLFLHIFAHFPL